MNSVTLPVLSDVDCPASQLVALGVQIHQAIRAAVGSACDERALDARLIEFMSAPSIGQAQAAALFGRDSVAALMRHGVLAPAPDNRLCPRFALRLVNGSLIITDLPSDRRKLPALYVDPLWESASLARMILHADGGDALDMGSGSGVLSLALASGSRHVYGAELNPRAMVLSRFNAALNGCSSVTFTRSDLFAEFGERRFDRIVFNAPVGDEFVGTDLLHAGETILAAFFRQLPSRLVPGGIAQINLCGMDWAGESLLSRIDRWLGAAAAQFQYVFLEQWRINSGRRFALHRLRGTLKTGRNCFACKAIVRGWITLRRRPHAPSWALATRYHDWVATEPSGTAAALLGEMLNADVRAATVGGTDSGQILSQPMTQLLQSARRVTRAHETLT